MKAISIPILLLLVGVFSLVEAKGDAAKAREAVINQAAQELDQFFRDNILSLKSLDKEERKDCMERHQQIIKQRNLKAICERYGQYWQHVLSTEEGVLKLPELKGMKPPGKNKAWPPDEYKKVTDAEVKVTDRKRLEILKRVLETSSAEQQISLLQKERRWLVEREKEAHFDDQGNPTKDFEPVNHHRVYKNCQRIGELMFLYYDKKLENE